MSHRPTDWHILDLDGDLTPGDPQRVRKVAGTLHDFADDVADALRDLKGSPRRPTRSSSSPEPAPCWTWPMPSMTSSTL